VRRRLRRRCGLVSNNYIIITKVFVRKNVAIKRFYGIVTKNIAVVITEINSIIRVSPIT